MHAPLSTDKMKYYQLMALVCEDLTADSKAIDALVRNGHEATSAQLSDVRFGRHVNLAWLIDLVRAILPQLVIPLDVLPAEPASLATPLFQA